MGERFNLTVGAESCSTSLRNFVASDTGAREAYFLFSSRPSFSEISSFARHSKKSMLCRSLVHLVFLLTASFLGTACQPNPDDLQERTIDTDRMMSHVSMLAADEMSGRRTGTDGGVGAARYVLQQMQAMALQPACGEQIEQTFSLVRRDGSSVEATNLLARIPGTGSSDAVIVVSAHFDHLGSRDGTVYNGADDNASGTAVLLELARSLAGAPPEHDVVFAAFDAEESGLRGASAFVESDCFSAMNVGLNLNMDMVSRSDSAQLYTSGTLHYPFLREVIEGVPPVEGMTILFGHDEPGSGSDDWTFASDHGPFHRAGVAFVYFGVEDHAGYHDPSDDIEAITPDFFKATGRFVLDVVEAMDSAIDSFPVVGQ